MGEQNELKNRYIHIKWEETTHSTSKQHIEQHIEQHIGQCNSGENSKLDADMNNNEKVAQFTPLI